MKKLIITISLLISFCSTFIHPMEQESLKENAIEEENSKKSYLKRVRFLLEKGEKRILKAALDKNLTLIVTLIHKNEDRKKAVRLLQELDFNEELYDTLHQALCNTSNEFIPNYILTAFLGAFIRDDRLAGQWLIDTLMATLKTCCSNITKEKIACDIKILIARLREFAIWSVDRQRNRSGESLLFWLKLAENLESFNFEY